jgi:hypothetical protein
MANAYLYDQSGVEVAMADGGERDLVSGAQPLNLKFDGKSIYKSGRWGPYTLRVTIVHDSTTTTIELDDARLGETAAYDYMQFQHDRVAVDPKSIATKAVDTNGDGLFDELDLTGTVTVETAGLYVINTSLYATEPWKPVAFASTTVQLAQGSNPFKLVFKGADIAKSGRDGPYVESGLFCYLEGYEFESLGMLVPDYTTAAYEASQFGP